MRRACRISPGTIAVGVLLSLLFVSIEPAAGEKNGRIAITHMRKIAGNGGRPAWSPDGARIAFDRRSAKDDCYDLWIMNADGSERRRLTFFNSPGHPHHTGDIVNAAAFSWNPAGTSFCGVLNRTPRGKQGSLELWLFKVEVSDTDL